MSDDHAADIDKHVRVYILVFVALAVLTMVTVAVRSLHLPMATGIAVALLIAIVKGSLVACYFMHLISERRLIFLVLVITVAFFVALLMLPVLTSSEHLVHVAPGA